MMRKTPLDAWLAERIGGPPNPGALWEYQRRAICETVDWARRKSRFYARLLKVVDLGSIVAPRDMAGLPRTSPADLKGADADFVCVSQSDVARIVTMETSGTTGPSKRVHFTANDLESTVDFFHHGMSIFTRPGQRVLVLMPGKRPGSVGDLLEKALARLGAETLVFGPVADPHEALIGMRSFSPHVVVGVPVHVLGLARRDALAGRSVNSVLLCSDNAPRSIIRAVREAWDCEVFTHWGMTETGLGGGVECDAHDGYHLRENDLYIEVADPETGEPLPAGIEGEVLVTTLTRRGMPLIRYRTGDAAELIRDACPCGSVTRRLGRITGRIGRDLPLEGGKSISITQMDEILFNVPGLVDYQAALKGGPGRNYLAVAVWAAPGKGDSGATAAMRLLEAMTGDNGLPVVVSASREPLVLGMAKRAIVDEREHRDDTCS